ncbi:MAG TPA: BTAD domain-containing putative transcriptional regulator, partial [Rhodanobacteraceae bacterium]|nr:BTAD domain-containing putative transcriptional regulator [Rhodanobacteraceae bacterium]
MSGASNGGSEAAGRWSLRLLGAFELRGPAGGERVALPGKRERLLLAYLALSPKGRQPRSKLAALLWGDSADETALDNLRTCLWALRKAFGDAKHRVLASDGDDVVLDLAPFDVDVLALRRVAASGDGVDLEAVAGLYSGELLAGLDVDSEEFESWRRAEAARCREQAVEVLARLMAERGAAKQPERAIEVGHAILALDPLHEDTVRQLMRLYAAGGRRTAAIQAYRSLAETLRAELGVEPEAATREMLAEVSRGDPPRSADVAARGVRAEPSPPEARSLPAAPAPRARVNFTVAIVAGVLLLAVGAV